MTYAGPGFFESELNSDQIGWLGRYGSYDYLVGRLIQSAIDAYMVSKGWTMNGSSESATLYRRSTTSAQGKGVNATTFETCTRPGPDGNGGGDVTAVATLNGAEQDREESNISFDVVKDDIHRIVDRFAGCPDPSGSSDVASLYNALSCHLIAGPGGSLTSALELIKAASVTLTGDTAEKYKETFLWSIESVLDNYSAFATLIAHFMSMQSGMWAATRANVIGMLIKSRVKFDDVAEKGPTGYNYDGFVNVVDIALRVARLFVPDSISTAIELATIAVDGITVSMPETVGAAATYDQVLTEVLKAGLDSIASQIEEVEEKIKYNVGLNLDSISDSEEKVRDLWQLPNPGSLDLSDEPDIATDLDSVIRVKGHMKSIVVTIGGYVQSGRDANDDMVSSVARSTDLGIGNFGPGLMMQELGDMFCDILNLLKNQIDLSADNLYAACMAMLSTNDEIAAQLAASSAGLQALTTPNGYADPWCYSKDPEPSPADQTLTTAAPTSPTLSASPEAQHTDFQGVVPEFEEK